VSALTDIFVSGGTYSAGTAFTIVLVEHLMYLV
jgi:hypothetical protein